MTTSSNDHRQRRSQAASVAGSVGREQRRSHGCTSDSAAVEAVAAADDEVRPVPAIHQATKPGCERDACGPRRPRTGHVYCIRGAATSRNVRCSLDIVSNSHPHEGGARGHDTARPHTQSPVVAHARVAEVRTCPRLSTPSASPSAAGEQAGTRLAPAETAEAAVTAVTAVSALTAFPAVKCEMRKL